THAMVGSKEWAVMDEVVEVVDFRGCYTRKTTRCAPVGDLPFCVRNDQIDRWTDTNDHSAPIRLCPKNPRRSLRRLRPGQEAHRETDDQYHRDADRIMPEIRHAASRGMKGEDDDEEDAADEASERPVPVRALERQRQHEHTQQRPVENRSDAVHDLDQRSKLYGHVRHDAGDDAPECDREPRYQRSEEHTS